MDITLYKHITHEYYPMQLHQSLDIRSLVPTGNNQLKSATGPDVTKRAIIDVSSIFLDEIMIF